MAIFMLLPLLCQVLNEGRGHCGRDRMVVWFTTTFAISAYHYWRCEFEPRSWRGALYTTLCDKVCQWFATGLWFSPGTSFSSTNKTDHIVESGIEHHKPTIACYAVECLMNTFILLTESRKTLHNRNICEGFQFNFR
jgi:hypothetical protein